MIDDDLIPEDEDMQSGDNLARNERALGAEAHKILVRSEAIFERHARDIQGKIHPMIVEFGLKLQAGRDMYAYDNNSFKDWVERRRLNFGVLGGSQQERTACMTIAKLFTEGTDADLPGGVSHRLDLSLCKRSRPTDIIKWARKEQPHLFDDLRGKTLGKAAIKPKRVKQEGDLPEDETGDLGVTGEAPWITALRAENERLRAQLDNIEGLLTHAAKLMLNIRPIDRANFIARLMKDVDLDPRDWKVEVEAVEDDDEPSTRATPKEVAAKHAVESIASAAPALSWSGSDASGWTAKSSSGTDYDLTRVSARSEKWNVAVYEDGAAQGQRLNKKPFASLAEAKAAAEADFAERGA